MQLRVFRLGIFVVCSGKISTCEIRAVKRGFAQTDSREIGLIIGFQEIGGRQAGRLKIPVRDYLGAVLPGVSDFPINRIAELTPATWATCN